MKNSSKPLQNDEVQTPQLNCGLERAVENLQLRVPPHPKENKKQNQQEPGTPRNCGLIESVNTPMQEVPRTEQGVGPSQCT